MGLIHYLVIHQMREMPSCYWFGRYINVYDDQLTSLGSICVHHHLTQS